MENKKGLIKREEELRKENEELKNEIEIINLALHTTMKGNDTEIERLTQSNNELVEALKLLYDVTKDIKIGVK